MSLAETLVGTRPSVRMDAQGVLRVGGSRVTLDLVVEEYRLGATAEDIASAYDTLDLADIHGAISFYLANQSEVEAYLAKRKGERRAIRTDVERRFPQAGLRKRLLARRTSGAG